MTMATAATATDASVAIRKRSAIEFSQTKAKQKCVREKVRYHHKAEICCLCLQWDLIYFEAAEDLLWWFRTGRAIGREKEWQKNRESKKNCWRKSTHVCYLRVLWRCLLLPGNVTDVWSLSLHVVDIFSMMCFFYFLTKTISFFCFIVCLCWVGKYGICVCHKSKFDI